MFGSHFYHATMRKSVAIFGTLFNNISVIRKSSDGGILNQIKVPLAYGPKQKYLSRIETEQDSDTQMAIKLPRMSFEITSIDQDLNQKLNKSNKIVENHASDVGKKKTIKQVVSYNISMSLNIMAKNQDDGLQIVEQILPYFQPDYTVTIKPIDSFDYKQDVPIVLSSVTISDDYEGDFLTRRVLVYTLAFTMKMKFFGPAGDQAVIREINLDYKDIDNLLSTWMAEDLTINPTTADESDNYTVVTSISDNNFS
jgi:hypothetical protein